LLSGLQPGTYHSRCLLRLFLEEAIEVGRVLEPEAVGDLCYGVVCVSQQGLGFIGNACGDDLRGAFTGERRAFRRSRAGF